MKTYELTPAEYKVVSAISANIAKRDNMDAMTKKENYKAIKAQLIECKESDPQALQHFEKWLNELNQASGYIKPQKATKTAKKEVKLNDLQGLKGLTIKSKPSIQANSAVNMRLAETLKVATKPAKKIGKTAEIKESKQDANNAKMAFLKDGLKAGIITNAMILHEVKEGHISLTDAMELIG